MIQEAQINDRKCKEIQKQAKDKKKYVKPHSIKVGDTVLLAQKKTKMLPLYDPKPFAVVEVRGHQITATRDGKNITRDAQKWKAFIERSKPNYEDIRQDLQDSSSSSDDDIDFSECCKKPGMIDRGPESIAASIPEEIVVVLNEPASQPRRNPRRNRQPTTRFR